MDSGVLAKDIRYLKGVGEQRAKLFAKLGVDTVGALLRFYPRRYIDMRRLYTLADAPEEESVPVLVTVSGKRTPVRISGGRTLYKADGFDDTGSVELIWFNNRFALSGLKEGESYVLYGKFTSNFLKREVINPTVMKPDAIPALLPLYPATAGLSSRVISGVVKAALALAGDGIPDPLPEDIRKRYSLVTMDAAIHGIHFPVSPEQAAAAKRRLVTQELLTLSLGMALIKGRKRRIAGAVMERCDPSEFIASLPFSLTGAQRRAVDEICADLKKTQPMSRLLQGDVGSGKTVVAAAAVYCAAKNGWQSAVMAPTEILANQHAETFSHLLSPFGISVALLTSSVKGKARRELLQRLETGEIDLLVGTHALITPEVSFSKLGFVCADEQHRFGVEQRFALSKKGQEPHLLVMSATPIPRTMALIIYGDLDITVIDELPPGRRPVKTYLVDEGYRARYLGFVRKTVAKGLEAYIVCPLVEESDSLEDVQSAGKYRDEIASGPLAGINVGLLHGRMKPKEKQEAMRAFASGETPVLVSTTVIEVGVDVPKAVLMIVENAERFGLSALHQLRGRVGRGADESFCILVSGARNPETRERLTLLCRTFDGFEIAENDLRARGPGDFLGSRQHGLPELHAADLSSNEDELLLARKISDEILSRDSSLAKAENAALRGEIAGLFDEKLGGRLN